MGCCSCNRQGAKNKINKLFGNVIPPDDPLSRFLLVLFVLAALGVMLWQVAGLTAKLIEPEKVNHLLQPSYEPVQTYAFLICAVVTPYGTDSVNETDFEFMGEYVARDFAIDYGFARDPTYKPVREVFIVPNKSGPKINMTELGIKDDIPEYFDVSNIAGAYYLPDGSVWKCGMFNVRKRWTRMRRDPLCRQRFRAWMLTKPTPGAYSFVYISAFNPDDYPVMTRPLTMMEAYARIKGFNTATAGWNTMNSLAISALEERTQGNIRRSVSAHVSPMGGEEVIGGHVPPELTAFAEARGYTANAVYVNIEMASEFVNRYVEIRTNYTFIEWLAALGGSLGLLSGLYRLIFPSIHTWQRRSVVTMVFRKLRRKPQPRKRGRSRAATRRASQAPTQASLNTSAPAQSGEASVVVAVELTADAQNQSAKELKSSAGS